MPARKKTTKRTAKTGTKRKTAAKKSPGKVPRTQDTERQLSEYHRKRDFSRTAEPRGGTAPIKEQLVFVIQKHAATRLHYDFRLELDGVTILHSIGG